MTAPFKLNQKIYVYKPEKKEQYVSAIERIEENKEITIALPISQSSSLVVRAGEIISVRLISESSCFEFSTPVKAIKIENVPLYVLHYPESIKRVQLRKHVRVNTLLDINYSRIPQPGELPEFKKAVAVDISAGGMKVSISEDIKENEALLVNFELPVKNSSYNFELRTIVTRSFAIEAGKKTLFQLGLSFVSITEAQRDNIYNYIFTKMAELRRDGKA
ncbi:MAG: flagellar brake protein [Bacillota bacterium]